MNQYNPNTVSIPGSSLLDDLKYKGISKRKLAQMIGCPVKTVRAIIRGKAEITPEIADKLEKVLRIPAGFWNNRERRYREKAQAILDSPDFKTAEESIKKMKYEG